MPAEFAVFPLAGALLLPHGKLPLNIFEPRYKAMVEDSLAGQRMFGMIQPNPTPGHESGLFRVGCLGRLSSFSETEDGRYLIALTGIVRFDVVSELEMRRGYRRVAGSFDRFLATDLAAPPETLPRRATLLQARCAAISRPTGSTPTGKPLTAWPTTSWRSPCAWSARSTRPRSRPCWKPATRSPAPTR